MTKEEIKELTIKNLENKINEYSEKWEEAIKKEDYIAALKYNCLIAESSEKLTELNEITEITNEEIKEIIYNAELDYSSLNIKDGRVKGYITVLVNDEEFKELSDIPYFYLDEYEIDINEYYKSAGLTLLNENVKEVFPDVEFQFRKGVA